VLLRSLIGRGLDPDGIILVVAGGAGGIATAVAEAFPDAAFGRCWAHRVRNLLDAIPLAERKSALRGLRTIYRASTKRAAVAAYWRFAIRRHVGPTFGGPQFLSAGWPVSTNYRRDARLPAEPLLGCRYSASPTCGFS
jgi:hypothetical protein